MARTARLSFGTTSAPALLVALTALAAGCASEDAGRGGSGVCIGAKCDQAGQDDDDDAEGAAPEFRAAVSACEKDADRLRSRTHAQRWNEQAGIERSRKNCLIEANDDILPAIDDIAQERDSDATGLERGISSYRDARELVCTTLVEASASALEKSAAFSEERCGATSELDFAKLVAAYVDLGSDAVAIADSRVRYPQCWSAYDDAEDMATLASQKRGAADGLIDCISDANRDATEELITKIQDQFPGRASDTLEQDTERAFRSHENAVKDVCEVLTLAGFTVDDTEVQLASLGCTVAGLSMVGHLGNAIVAGVWPEGDEAPADDGDDGDGDDDDGDGDDGSTDEGGESGGDETGGDESGGGTDTGGDDTDSP